MQFPPRATRPGYLELNPLGTVPTLVDGELVMTESVAMCDYLANRYGPSPLSVAPNEADYGRYLNFLYQSDATLTFPQTIVLRYMMLEPEERRLPQAVADYTQWFFSRLKGTALLLGNRRFVAGGRFTIADIAFTYALQLATTLKLGAFPDNVAAYFEDKQARGGYQRALARESAG